MWSRSRNKFGAKRTNGFASALENAVHKIMLLRLAAGEFESIRCQHSVEFKIGEKVKRRWKCDFSGERRDGSTVFVEAKGVEDWKFKLVKDLWKEQGQGDLEIWKGHYSKPRLVAVIKKKPHKNDPHAIQ